MLSDQQEKERPLQCADSGGAQGDQGAIQFQRQHQRYSYQVNGIEYRLKTLDHSLQVSGIGDSCTIWYNPAKPKDAQAFRGSDKYLRILLIIGIVFTLLGIVLFILGLV